MAEKYIILVVVLDIIFLIISLRYIVLQTMEEEYWSQARKPKYLGMKKSEIGRIELMLDCIYWYDKDLNRIYYETFDWYWENREYKDWKEIYYETSDWFWSKREYKDWEMIYYENSDWYKQRIENWKKIEYRDNKYYIDGKEAESI